MSPMTNGYDEIEFVFDKPVMARCGGMLRSTDRQIILHPPQSQYKLIFVERGMMKLSHGERDLEVSGGGYVIITSGCDHQAENISSLELKTLWLDFNFGPTVGIEEHARANLLYIKRIPCHGRLVEPDRFANLFHNLLSAQTTYKDDDRADVVDMYTTILLRKLSSRKTADQKIDSIAHIVERTINAEQVSTLSLDRIASRLNYNKDYLSRIYKHEYNKSITQAIIDRKIRTSERLLEDETVSIKSVAGRSGFSDPTLFRRIFIRYHGMNPSTFRSKICRRTPIMSEL